MNPARGRSAVARHRIGSSSGSDGTAAATDGWGLWHSASGDGDAAIGAPPAPESGRGRWRRKRRDAQRGRQAARGAAATSAAAGPLTFERQEVPERATFVHFAEADTTEHSARGRSRSAPPRHDSSPSRATPVPWDEAARGPRAAAASACCSMAAAASGRPWWATCASTALGWPGRRRPRARAIAATPRGGAVVVACCDHLGGDGEGDLEAARDSAPALAAGPTVADSTVPPPLRDLPRTAAPTEASACQFLSGSQAAACALGIAEEARLPAGRAATETPRAAAAGAASGGCQGGDGKDGLTAACDSAPALAAGPTVAALLASPPLRHTPRAAATEGASGGRHGGDGGDGVAAARESGPVPAAGPTVAASLAPPPLRTAPWATEEDAVLRGADADKAAGERVLQPQTDDAGLCEKLVGDARSVVAIGQEDADDNSDIVTAAGERVLHHQNAVAGLCENFVGDARSVVVIDQKDADDNTDSIDSGVVAAAGQRVISREAATRDAVEAARPLPGGAGSQGFPCAGGEAAEARPSVAASEDWDASSLATDDWRSTTGSTTGSARGRKKRNATARKATQRRRQAVAEAFERAFGGPSYLLPFMDCATSYFALRAMEDIGLPRCVGAEVEQASTRPDDLHAARILLATRLLADADEQSEAAAPAVVRWLQQRWLKTAIAHWIRLQAKRSYRAAAGAIEKVSRIAAIVDVGMQAIDADTLEELTARAVTLEANALAIGAECPATGGSCWCAAPIVVEHEAGEAVLGITDWPQLDGKGGAAGAAEAPFAVAD